MALGTITFVRYIQPRRGVRERVISMVGPNPYTVGGETVTAANMKLNAIDSIVFEPPHPLVDRIYKYNKVAGKIEIQVISTAAEAGAINCSADIVRARVIGY